MIYLVYVMIGFGGMVITAQLGPLALDFGVEKQIVTILGLSLPVLTLAASVDNFANGITRPLCGFLSDKIGRENTMLLVFTAEGLAFAGMIVFGRHPLAFVLFAALIFLFWGEIFSIFPAICGDTFGVKHAAANNGLLYTAKGTSALAVPLANLLVIGHRNLDERAPGGVHLQRGRGYPGEVRRRADAASPVGAAHALQPTAAAAEPQGFNTLTT